MARADSRMHDGVFLLAMVILLSMAFALIGLNKAYQATDPDWEDTGPYLQIALFISQNGGVTNFPLLCLTGEYTANNQHPLYPLLLTPFAARNLAFFENAKLVSLGMGWAAVLACLFLGRYLFGVAAGSLAATALALNETFLQSASHVASESTLTLFIVLFLYGAIRSLEQIHGAGWAAFAGASAGLAFLTKGTALLLLPVYAAAHALKFGVRGTFNTNLGMFVGLFLLSASPLLVRNWLLYGTPTYGGINAHILWFDSWWDVYDPRYALLRQWPEVSWIINDAPTWRSYLDSHSLSEILSRIAAGIVGEATLIRQSMAAVLPLAQDTISPAILALCAVGFLSERNRLRRWLVLVFLCAFIAPFVWYFQVVPAMRFVLPLIPVLCLYAAEGFLRLAGFLEARWSGREESSLIGRWSLYANTAMLLLVVCVLGIRGIRAPEHRFAFTSDYEELSKWVGSNVRPNDLILMSSDNPYWRYGWHVGLKGKISIWMPERDVFRKADLSVLERLLQNDQAESKYVIIHQEDVEELPFLMNYFEVTLPAGLVEKQPIEGWRLIHASSHKPVEFLIYRADRRQRGGTSG